MIELNFEINSSVHQRVHQLLNKIIVNRISGKDQIVWSKLVEGLAAISDAIFGQNNSYDVIIKFFKQPLYKDGLPPMLELCRLKSTGDNAHKKNPKPVYALEIIRLSFLLLTEILNTFPENYADILEIIKMKQYATHVTVGHIIGRGHSAIVIEDYLNLLNKLLDAGAPANETCSILLQNHMMKPKGFFGVVKAGNYVVDYLINSKNNLSEQKKLFIRLTSMMESEKNNTSLHLDFS